MHSLKARSTLAQRLAERHGLDEETAGRYANLIGDCPEFDMECRLVVRDEGGEIIALLSTRPESGPNPASPRSIHAPPGTSC